MKKHKKRSLWIFLVCCMVIISTEKLIFATDYDNHWAKSAIEKWSDKGLVVGYEDGTFRPSHPITRGELATILVRVFNFKDTAHSKDYIDVNQDKWYAENIGKISSAQIMNDEGDHFRPEDPAIREEAAYAFAQAYKITSSRNKFFTDELEASKWAIESINSLCSQGFISGNPDGTFAPKRILTRADVVVMIDKITSELMNEAGLYTKDVAGNLVINTKDVILKDMTISGNLYFTEGIGEGNITCNNVTVEGEAYLDGGELSSMTLKDCQFLKGINISTKKPITLENRGEYGLSTVDILQGTRVMLLGGFGELTLPQGVTVVIKDGWVGNITVNPRFLEAKDLRETIIDIDENSVVGFIEARAPVVIKGKGSLETLLVNSNGIKTEQIPNHITIIKPEFKVNIAGEEVVHGSLLD